MLSCIVISCADFVFCLPVTKSGAGALKSPLSAVDPSIAAASLCSRKHPSIHSDDGQHAVVRSRVADRDRRLHLVLHEAAAQRALVPPLVHQLGMRRQHVSGWLGMFTATIRNIQYPLPQAAVPQRREGHAVPWFLTTKNVRVTSLLPSKQSASSVDRRAIKVRMITLFGMSLCQKKTKQNTKQAVISTQVYGKRRMKETSCSCKTRTLGSSIALSNDSAELTSFPALELSSAL